MTPQRGESRARAPREAYKPEDFGYRVMGPIFGEFCLRLWSISCLIEDPRESTLLFCARGGLRMRLAYEHFLAATHLESPLASAPLMVSRAIVIGSSLMRAVRERPSELFPAAATFVTHELSRQSVGQALAALAGMSKDCVGPGWDIPCTPESVLALLQHPDGAPIVDRLESQEALFAEHLDEALGGRSQAILVDTGFFGSTRELLAEARPDLDLGSVMIAKSFRSGYPRRGSRSIGLLVEAETYNPGRRRTVLLRYWHFIEWLFEPELPSVSTFHRENGSVRSDLEIPGWRERVDPDPESVFDGLLRYLDELPASPAERVITDTGRAWTELRRAILWPSGWSVHALEVGARTHGLGREEQWGARPWRGPVAALTGNAMWREGEIARSGTRLRLPLLLGIEGAYSFRFAWRQWWNVRR